MSAKKQPATLLSGQEDACVKTCEHVVAERGGGGGWGVGGGLYPPEQIVIIYNRYRLTASRTLNINVKRIYGNRKR